MTKFFKVQLRTTDVSAARAFYAEVLGHDALDVVPLHASALARGARPHWLGYLEVDDVDRASLAFTLRGAVALGPAWVDETGLRAATMRDPGGAIVALAKPPPTGVASTGPEAQSKLLLHTRDVELSKASYREVAGWAFGAPIELAEHGVFHPFAWEPGGETVGHLCDVASRTGVHPHWQFRLPVSDVAAATEAARAAGGLVAVVVTLATGERIAVCDDPQGAAFSCVEPAPRSGSSGAALRGG